MAENKAFLVYFSDEALYNALSNEDAGAVLKAALAYAHYGEEPDLTGYANFAWLAVKGRIDADREHWESVKAKRAAAGQRGMASRWGNQNNKC